MAGMMYNMGLRLTATDGVSPVISRITLKTAEGSMAMMAFGKNIQRAVSKMPGFMKFGAGGGFLGSMLKGAAIYGSLNLIQRGISGVIQETGRFETANLQFSKLIGNAELATETLKEMQMFAATTPFEFKQSQEISKGLLAAGVAAQELIPTMRMIGDLSMGDPEKVERLSYAFGKAKMLGKATWRDLNMFATAGVPILETIRNQMGLSQESLERFVRAGKVKFPVLQKALEDLAAPGGKFHGMMLEMMATIPGLWSNFLDIIGMVQRSLGGVFKDELKSVIIQMQILGGKTVKWIEANKEMLKQNVGVFFTKIAEALSKIDPQKIFDTIGAMMSFAKWAFKAWIAVSLLTTTLSMAGGILKFVGAVSVAVKAFTALRLAAVGVSAIGPVIATGMTPVAAAFAAVGLSLGPVLVTLGIMLALIVAIAATWRYFVAKAKGEKFMDFLPGRGKKGAVNLGTPKNQMDFMNSILGGGVPAQGQGTATQIIKGATDGVAPKRPISLEAQQSLQRFENSTTFNNNNASNITLSLDKGLVANSRGGLPAGVHLRGYNLGSSLA